MVILLAVEECATLSGRREGSYTSQTWISLLCSITVTHVGQGLSGMVNLLSAQVNWLLMV